MSEAPPPDDAEPKLSAAEAEAIASKLATLPVDDLQELIEELWEMMTPEERGRMSARLDKILADEAAGRYATH